MSKPALHPAAFLLVLLSIVLLSIGIVARASAEVPKPAACLLNRAAAQGGGDTAGAPSADRLATLARGVNLTDLFGESNVEPLGPLFRHLRLAGVRHVRIPISPRIFSPDAPAWQSHVLARLDQAVCAAIATGLGVVIDLHPTSALEPIGGTDEQIADRLSAVWQPLAARYADASPGLVFFEVLNETEVSGWPGVGASAEQHRARDTIGCPAQHIDPDGKSLEQSGIADRHEADRRSQRSVCVS